MNFRGYKISEKRMLPINSFKSICINSERLTEDEYNDLVIMKGTGMFDKKGVEIFEGDFCKNELEEYGLISYSEGSFGCLILTNQQNNIYQILKSMIEKIQSC